MTLYFPNLIQINDNNHKLNWTGFHKLPEPYEEHIQDLVFKLDSSYLTEIRRTRENAICEWDLRRGRLDTMVRDWCLKPAIAFTQTHFKLLWDRITDTDLRYSSWLQYALPYKMWLGQTGGACVFRNAGLHDLNRWVDRLLTNDDNPLSEEQHTTLKDLENFRREITKFQEERWGPRRKGQPRTTPRLKRMRFEGAYKPDTYASPFTGKKV